MKGISLVSELMGNENICRQIDIAHKRIRLFSTTDIDVVRDANFFQLGIKIV